MSTRIIRDSLPISAGQEILYSTYCDDLKGDYRNALLICLHPGWGGHIPSPYYGELFLTSIFIPAFAYTGALLAAPDCPAGAWNNPVSCEALLGLHDHLVDRHGISQKLVSLVGYSAGGWGAWYLLQEDPQRFCSAILFATSPVIDPVDRLEQNFHKCEELLADRLDEWLGRLTDIPIYMIHSRDDELLPYACSKRAYQTLLDDKRQVEFDTLRGVGHFDGEGYITALQACIPWLIDTWRNVDGSS